MRVVIDTNVVVSAALKDRKPETVILFVANHPEFDQKDAKFLTCAMAAQAHYLVTGDRDFEEAYKIGITTVLSVSLFHQFICEKW
jgi:predicted nucleic acid-binding protein